MLTKQGNLLGRGTLEEIRRVRKSYNKTSPVVQWLRFLAPNGGGEGRGWSSIPGQGTRSHMRQPRVQVLQLKILHATMKSKEFVCHNQIKNK